MTLSLKDLEDLCLKAKPFLNENGGILNADVVRYEKAMTPDLALKLINTAKAARKFERGTGTHLRGCSSYVVDVYKEQGLPYVTCDCGWAELNYLLGELEKGPKNEGC